MKCLIDQTEMEMGYLRAHGQKWTNGKGLMGGLFKPHGDTVVAYKCSKCGKIELKFGG